MTTPDPLIALAERWETWAAEASTLAALMDDEAGRAHLRAQAEQRIADATDLRSLAGDTTPRTFTVQLPAGLPLVNANKRMHRMRQADLTRGIREAAGHVSAHVPRLQRAHIICEYRPPDRRRRDVHNLYPSAKAAVDGLVDVGVLPDDSDRYLIGPDMRCGDVEPAGRLVLHITELEVPRV